LPWGRRRAMGELLDKGEQRTTEALLSAENVAEYFGVKTTTVYRWCKEGRIPCLKIGKHWRMRRGQLVDFLEAEEPEEG
jgi:excisionase family DNA binding protein